jgi:hypothetical protein
VIAEVPGIGSLSLDEATLYLSLRCVRRLLVVDVKVERIDGAIVLLRLVQKVSEERVGRRAG